MSNIWIWIWLAIIIVTVIIEVLTVGLTTIWMTGGAVVALIVSLFHAPAWLQIGLFFIVTFMLIFFTRPWAVKMIDAKSIKTNYEEVIGKEVRVLEVVDNAKETGKALFNGMEWSARAADKEEHFEPEEMAVVAGISGVKLLLKKSE